MFKPKLLERDGAPPCSKASADMVTLQGRDHIRHLAADKGLNAQPPCPCRPGHNLRRAKEGPCVLASHSSITPCVKWSENLNEFLGESLPLTVNFSSSCTGHSWIFHYMHFISVHVLRFRARGRRPPAAQILDFILICRCAENEDLHVDCSGTDSAASCFVYGICSQKYFFHTFWK